MTEQKSNKLTAAEEKRLAVMERRYRNAARAAFESRTAYYHKVTGGRYTAITVRDQKSLWGSCSSKRNLNFNWRLIMAPPQVARYVVVHEMCHLKHMNHSKEFWKEVADILPDYQEWKRWLRKHGDSLMSF